MNRTKVHSSNTPERSLQDTASRKPMDSVENRHEKPSTSVKRKSEEPMFDLCDASETPPAELKKRHVWKTPIPAQPAARNRHLESMNSDEANNLHESDLSTDEDGQPSSTAKPHHRTKPLARDEVSTGWSMVHTHGVGLRNTDTDGKSLNICYINGVIQCLANTAPLAQWLLDDRNHRTCDMSVDDEFCSVCLLRSIVIDVYQNNTSNENASSPPQAASALRMAQQISKFSSNFVFREQQDPSEFLIALLNSLMRCLSSNESGSNTTYMSNPFRFLIGMNILSSVQCDVCSAHSKKETYESIWSIAIASCSSLRRALAGFCAEERLSGDNSFNCSKCQKRVKARRSCSLSDVSPILFIHLKRFVYDLNTGRTSKLKHFVSYPALLDLSPFMEEKDDRRKDQMREEKRTRYQLYAVLVHSGETTENGHIFSYVQCPDKLWYKADDELMTRVRSDVVFNDRNSYILCYSKSSTVTDSRSASTQNELRNRSSKFYTSTPERHTQRAVSSFDRCSPISSIGEEEIHRFATHAASPMSNASCPMSNTCPTDEAEHQSTLSKDLRTLRMELFPAVIRDGIEMRTESRIEIVRGGQHGDERRDCVSNSSSFSTKERLSAEGTDSFYRSSNDLSLDCERSHSSSSPSVDADGASSSEDAAQEEDFVVQLSTSYDFKLNSVHFAKIQAIRTMKNNKKRARLFEAMGIPVAVDKGSRSKKIIISKQKQGKIAPSEARADDGKDSDQHEPKESRVDVEYLYTLFPYIKRFNPYCGLCVRNSTWGHRTDERYQLLRCMLYCSGRPACPFQCSVIVRNSGKAVILVTNPQVRHPRGTKICRPMRRPVRSALKRQFANGASAYRVYQDRLQSRPARERAGNNYDVVGKSRSIFRKIKSEGSLESLLAADIDQGVWKLYERFHGEVNVDGKVTGAIQYVSKFPCQIIVFSETSIRLFADLLKQNNVVVSWDATGSIIQERKNKPRLLYYELSVTLPGLVTEDSIVPITFMISDAHALLNVVHWLQVFKQSYSQVFIGKPFPRPRIVLSDRAQVFLTAALQIWNNETMKEFLDRAYRIVTDDASGEDYEKTNIHACLAHVLIDARRTINKFVSESLRELAMWSIALLVNASTWAEFKHQWTLISVVFIQLHLGNQYVHAQSQDALLDQISKLRSDPNTVDGMKTSEQAQDDDDDMNFDQHDSYDFDDASVQMDHSGRGLPRSRQRKLVLDEEEEANGTESPFKAVINRIFQDALAANGLSLEHAFGRDCIGILRWFKYLTRFFMPTSPVWSNLLLGDLNRHRRRIVRSFEKLTVTTPEQRTTAISERRMGILKRTQLGGRIHIRLDVLLAILVPDMLSIVDEFSNAFFNQSTASQASASNESSLSQATRLKPIHERWRENVNRRDRGYYSKQPDEPIITDLVSSLLVPRTDMNANLKLPSVSPDWLSVAIRLLLSIGNNNDDIHFDRSAASDCPLLRAVTTFIDDWLSSRANDNRRKRSVTVDFSLPVEPLEDLSERSAFILERILVPLLPCHLVINKFYYCKPCNLTRTMMSTLTSITVNVVRSGLHLQHELRSFFSPTISDVPCASCGKPYVRHIEVVKWPPVLIINVSDAQKNIKFRQTPSIISLNQFSNWLAIGCPSSSVYDLVCFNSIVRSHATEAMVQVTKLKRSWLTSVNKRLIGDGEQLRRLFAHSRVLLFERVHGGRKLNFIHAIAQCCTGFSEILSGDLPSCSTLQEAVSIIETNSSLRKLKRYLTANVKTFLKCHSCGNTSDALVSSSNQTFIFKASESGQSIARPIVPDSDLNNNVERTCDSCESTSNGVQMEISKQIFLEPPQCLLAIANRDVRPNRLFNSELTITDVDDAQHSYASSAVLLISRFSDSMTVVKHESNGYIQYTSDAYSEPVDLPSSRLFDLIDTSSAILVFHQQDLDRTNDSDI